MLMKADIDARQHFAGQLLLYSAIPMLGEFKELNKKLVEPSGFADDFVELLFKFKKPIKKPVEPDSFGENLVELLLISGRCAYTVSLVFKEQRAR